MAGLVSALRGATNSTDPIQELRHQWLFRSITIVMADTFLFSSEPAY
jgi:ABC-type multidrug transport system fused ATPase/permease subunit